jgi:hypothetical protein
VDAEVTGRKEYVCYIQQFEVVWAIRVMKGGRRDRSCTKPIGMRVPTLKQDVLLEC